MCIRWQHADMSVYMCVYVYTNLSIKIMVINSKPSFSDVLTYIEHVMVTTFSFNSFSLPWSV